MTEQVRWTASGKAALAELRGEILRDASDDELKKAIFAGAKRFAPSWKRGLAKADDEGKAAAELALATIAKGKLPKRPSVEDAARLTSLIGASESKLASTLGELFFRTRGAAFAIEVLARMWSHKSVYHNPDWPKSEKRLATWIVAIEDDDDDVHDCSCSYSKGEFARYLARRWRASPAAERAEMKKGVTAIWKDTTPHARPALAYATNDPKRAKQSAEELIHAGEDPYPHFAWDQLPYVVTDPELALRILGDNSLHACLIENLGLAVWDLYVERIGSHIRNDTRADLFRDFMNFYGPRTAMVFAEYEDTNECREHVVEYFGLYPELLDKVIDDPSLKYHRDDLLKLRADKPAQARPR